MIKNLMSSKHRPPESYGDCYRTCAASILEKPNDKVPHFVHDDPTHDEWLNRREAWFKSQGLKVLNIFFLEDPRETMEMLNPDVLYILTGEGTKGVNHSVVCKGKEVAWDPANTDDAHIVGPCLMETDETRVYWVDIILGTPLSYTKVLQGIRLPDGTFREE